MSMSAASRESVSQAYLDEIAHRLARYRERIEHCVRQLDDGQVWWRPSQGHNSIANILLHLCGNLRQWVVAGVGGAADTRDRPREFSERGPIGRDELLGRLHEAVARAIEVVENVNHADLLEPRQIQGFEETVLSALFDATAHLSGHAQEIVYITRLQLGDAYQFAWTPQ